VTTPVTRSRRGPVSAVAVVLILVVVLTALVARGQFSRDEPPGELATLFRAAAVEHPGVTASVLAAQARVESKFRADAVSAAGAEGLMQFMPLTWQAYGVDGNDDGVADPFDPADAILAAASYHAVLAQEVAEVPGDPLHNVLAAYNAGPTAVLDAGGVPPYDETQAYVADVLRWSERYAYLDS
jgi:soluble lytic murein transglycosylase-like protein